MSRTKYFLSAILLGGLSANVCAWWSLEADDLSTHKKISGSVMYKIIDTGKYADLRQFSGTLIDGTSGKDNDNNAHGELLTGDTNYPLAAYSKNYDGGPFKLWYDLGLERYKSGKFTGDTDSAYYYFALMTHLVLCKANS